MERPLTSAVTPEATPPVWLQEKTQRLQALFNQREQKGGDLHPVGELMQDFEPPMQQKKFSEAEALVDRAFKLLAVGGAWWLRRDAFSSGSWGAASSERRQARSWPGCFLRIP